MRKNKLLKDKRSQSVIIGYVLLIVIAVTMSFIVYNYLKSYVPSDKTECPVDISLVVRSYGNDCTNGKLTLELENKGFFNVSAYSIRGSVNEERDKANINLASNPKIDYDFLPKELKPQEKTIVLVDYSDNINLVNSKLEFIEITPYIREGNKNIICGNVKIKQDSECSAAVVSCTPGEHRCNVNNYEICNPQGNGWDITQTCTGATPYCDLEENGCVACRGGAEFNDCNDGFSCSVDFCASGECQVSTTDNSLCNDVNQC
ncbi:MAG: hypothetical protein AABY22_00185, partial [Nanoarchaeota archaeon]